MVRKQMNPSQDSLLIRQKLKLIFRLFLRKQGLILRLLVCWALASFVMYTDERTNFDTRFKIRGAQAASSQIVILWLRPADINRYYDVRTQTLINLNELNEFSDGFFWDQRLWYQILKSILEQNPRSIGVSVFFGDSLGNIEMTHKESNVFFNSKVFWATQLNSFDQMILPKMGKSDMSNIGQYEIYRDEDGLVRKVVASWAETPHLTEKISGMKFPQNSPAQLINFRGPTNKVFTSVTAEEVLNHELKVDFFKNKIVLIGVDSGSSSRYLTPIGLLTRTEINAHILDNLIEHRWIQKSNNWVYAIYALFLVLLATFVVTQYPQSIAFAFLFWMGLLCMAISAWSFDSLNIWVPGVSSLILILIVWVVFVGYQATKVERRNYMLEQEQKYLQELEQLKSNFVSLISHDLKTPLAKIQSVVDRLRKNSEVNTEINKDFLSLENYTSELNRYIQSILKVMRVESRDFQINKTSVDLNEMIEDVVKSLQPLAQMKNLNLKLELEPLFLVDLDAILIREVIHNIIENAIKYSLEGKEIIVKSFETEDEEIGFLVEDQGEGIPPDEISTVWGKFVRGQSQSHRSKGTGLGLYLVKYFVELHAGRVTLQSTLGQGTTIGFYLPLLTDSEVSV
jgi:two-component system, OmpR family, phosphate regulon sensor histidine kinase PhoR